MTDEKMDMNDFRREMIDRGLDDEEALESLENDRKKIHMLTFGLDNKKTNVISHVNGKVTFVDSRFPGKVEVGDVWICSVSPGNNITVNYAMPIYKVTASFLISLDSNLREKMIDSLWDRNKGMFESDFAQRYKNEIHDLAIEEARAELDGIINELKGRNSMLEEELERERILNKSLSASHDSTQNMIELGSEINNNVCIELGSAPLCADAEAPAIRMPTIPKIPNTYRAGSPGMPEIRVVGAKESVPHMVFNVERIGEETLFSESFTDHKYFVHISPDANILTIRPNEFGSALCINRRIRLKGLNNLSPFTEKKELAAEYSEKYEGLLVYL